MKKKAPKKRRETETRDKDQVRAHKQPKRDRSQGGKGTIKSQTLHHSHEAYQLKRAGGGKLNKSFCMSSTEHFWFDLCDQILLKPFQQPVVSASCIIPAISTEQSVMRSMGCQSFDQILHQDLPAFWTTLYHILFVTIQRTC